MIAETGRGAVEVEQRRHRARRPVRGLGASGGRRGAEGRIGGRTLLLSCMLTDHTMSLHVNN